MAVTDKISLDFQFLGTGDPKKLIIIDTSVWGFIEDKPAIIEITVPGATNPVVYNFVKNSVNIFNSSNLYLSKVGDRRDLPDGIYKITLKGSPDSNCKNRYVLKDDNTRLQLYKLYGSIGPDYNPTDDVVKIIKKNKFLLDAANAAIVEGKVARAESFLSSVISNLNNYSECNNCN